MKTIKIWFLLVFVSILFIRKQEPCFAQQDGDDIVIGTYSIIHSHILDEDRLLYIHLPRGYEDTQLEYPVMYLLYVDVYNYFGDAASITEKLGGTGEMPPLIIVGVANTNRYRDLLPVQTRRLREAGGAEHFLKFIENELIPYVDKTYRTKPFRILAGPQAAAVFSLYTLINRPNLFHMTISENPFMNPENAEYLYPQVEQFFRTTETLKHFLYIRCEKNERPQDLEYAQRLNKLLDTDKPDGFRYQIEFIEQTGFFIPPLPFKEAFRSYFALHKLPEGFEAGTLKDILDYYEKRSEEYEFPVDPPEHLLTFEGVKLNRKGKTSEAIEIFQYQHELYPKSLNALFQLGESYRGLGEFENAIKYYKAFLDIEDRDVAFIQIRLEEIEKMIDGSAAYRIEQIIREKGMQAGLKKYTALQNDPENKLYFDENEFNAMGYRFMGTGQMENAILIFKLNVGLYPESANVYDSLAEAYMRTENREKAVENYNKSLELNPENKNAEEMLKKLEQGD